MKLLERYSTQCGLKIGKQFLLEKFYPLPDNKPYILVHGSSGMPGKNYPYYNEVMDILVQILTNNGINIYQIGGKEDVPIKHCIHLQGLTSLHQTNYLIGKALLLIGNDSWTSHRAGALNVPIVELFGTTSVSNHSPYQYNPRSIFLSSHRFDRKPSFAPNEAPLTIGLIPPENVVNAVLKILGGNFQINRKS
jgi:ADP-heptose:LPS heptosyltransferase